MGNISIKTISVSGFKGAFQGMRAPMMSYDKSDSGYDEKARCFVIGEKDMDLAKRLISGGTEHCKFRRMIHVQALISLPRYVLSELDTYKISTVSNSESTMHRLLNTDTPITEDQFYFGDQTTMMYGATRFISLPILEKLEGLRQQYKGIKPTVFTKVELLTIAKRILPESFIQTRVWDVNYETLANIYNQRVKHPHRLKEEWVECFGSWVQSLPYAKELIIGDENV